MTALFDSKNLMRAPPVLVGLTATVMVLLPIVSWRVFMATPEEEVMGFVQKIFYFHVPCAWNMFLAVGIAAIGSVGYLIKQTDVWDRIEDTSVDLALLFGLIVLITGPLWGRKAWGAYWVWDVRLTSSLVLFLTLVACKIVRSYAGPSARQISAGLTLFAVVDSIFVYFCVQFWKTTHPAKVVTKLDPEMAQTFLFSLAVWSLVFVVLFWLRMRLGELRNAVDRLHHLATEAGLDE